MASGPTDRRGLQFGQGATQSIKSWEEKEEEGKKSESRWRRGWGTRRTDVKSRFYNRDDPTNGGKAGDRGEGETSVDRTRTGTESISSGPVRFVLQVCGPVVVSNRPALRPSRGHNELGHWGVGRRTIKTLTHFRSFGHRIVRSCISTRLHESSGKLIPRPLSSRQRGAAEPNRMGSFKTLRKNFMHSASSSLPAGRARTSVLVRPPRPFSRAPLTPQFDP